MRLAVLVTLGMLVGARVMAAEPVGIGIEAEFGLPGSTSAQAIERGVRLAAAEINARGGVLGGRPLEVVIRDNRSVPARSQENLRDLAALPDMVAVFCGRYSPVVIEDIALVHQLGLILLDPWASADSIVDSGFTPNYIFRLSLADRWALPAMMRHAWAKGTRRVGVLLPNTSWGRSSKAAIERTTGAGVPAVVGTAWYNWGDKSLMRPYLDLLQQGAQAILFVANDSEGGTLMREMLSLPKEQRLPLILHWGVTGGALTQAAGGALGVLDLSVVQTFSFLTAEPRRLAHFLQQWRHFFGPIEPENIISPVGVAHAYDLTHLLARAIDAAGSTDRSQVRAALERLREHEGVIRRYVQPFGPNDHEALGPENVFMAVFRADGVIVPLPAPGAAR